MCIDLYWGKKKPGCWFLLFFFIVWLFAEFDGKITVYERFVAEVRINFADQFGVGNADNFYCRAILDYIDVLVDGRFEEALKDVGYHWAGSTNQRVINVPQSLKEGRVILHESN